MSWKPLVDWAGTDATRQTALLIFASLAQHLAKERRRELTDAELDALVETSCRLAYRVHKAWGD